MSTIRSLIRMPMRLWFRGANGSSRTRLFKEPLWSRCIVTSHGSANRINCSRFSWISTHSWRNGDVSPIATTSNHHLQSFSPRRQPCDDGPTNDRLPATGSQESLWQRRPYVASSCEEENAMRHNGRVGEKEGGRAIDAAAKYRPKSTQTNGTMAIVVWDAYQLGVCACRYFSVVLIISVWIPTIPAVHQMQQKQWIIKQLNRTNWQTETVFGKKEEEKLKRNCAKTIIQCVIAFVHPFCSVESFRFWNFSCWYARIMKFVGARHCSSIEASKCKFCLLCLTNEWIIIEIYRKVEKGAQKLLWSNLNCATSKTEFVRWTNFSFQIDEHS